MNRNRIHFLVWLLAGLLCNEPALFGQEKKFDTMRGVNRGQPATPVATLVVGINEAAGSVAEPGWPLIVSATRQPDATTAAIPLPSSLTVKLTDGNGTEIVVTFQPVPKPSATTTSPEIDLHWLASEAATAGLAPGRYRVSLLPAQGPLTGWRVEFGEFQVTAPNPDRSALLSQLKIQRWILLGRNDDALAEADRAIAADANDVHAWIAKGDLLMKRDSPDEALRAYDRALNLHKETDGEPLTLMRRRRSAFFRGLEKRGVIAPQPLPP